MSKHHHSPHGIDGNRSEYIPRPYWKRAHNDWRFWIGVVLMFLSITVYVMSGDLALRPRLQPPQPLPTATSGAQ